MDFSEYKDVIKALACAQEVDHDRREKMREVNAFVTDPRAQWEDSVWETFDKFKRPRYTLDKCRPMLASIWGELADNEFQIRVRSSGIGSDDDTADTFAGLVRAIENRSGSSWVYAQAGKKSIAIGMAAWRVEQDYMDGDSFDQELFIRPIHDAVDRVWFLGNYQAQTAEDSDAVVILHLVSKSEFEEKFKQDRTPVSVSCDRSESAYYNKRDGYLIAELIYKKPINKTIWQLADGQVVSDEDYQKIGDVEGARSRVRETHKICVRYFDGQGFISDEEDTVFDLLPVVPVFPNFEITDNKPISFGAIEWLMDQQRIRNYAGSRMIEETALAPKPKLMMTNEQAAGHEGKLSTMNNNNDPVQIYNHEPDHIPPYYPQTPGTNSGLADIFAVSSQGIEESAGMFGPNLAKNEGIQSGVAIAKQQHKGDIGTIEYFKALQVAIAHSGKIVVRALPKMFTEERTVKIVREDGQFDEVTLYERGINEQTQEIFVYNDLRKGSYDVVCDIGPAFANRREETAAQIIAMGSVDPTVITQNKDLLLNAQETPGMKIAAERARMQLIREGQIPEWQLTDEEKERIQQAQLEAQQNPPPPDPATIIAEAEARKAEAEVLIAQANVEKTKIGTQAELFKLQQAQQKLDFDQQAKQIEMMGAAQQQQAEQQMTTVRMLKEMAETLKTIKEATGAAAVVSPVVGQAYEQQASAITSAQQQL